MDIDRTRTKLAALNDLELDMLDRLTKAEYKRRAQAAANSPEGWHPKMPTAVDDRPKAFYRKNNQAGYQLGDEYE
jgi:hypothetical protein